MNPNSSFGGFSFGGGAPSFGSPAPITTAASTNLSFGGLSAPAAASAG